MHDYLPCCLTMIKATLFYTCDICGFTMPSTAYVEYSGKLFTPDITRNWHVVKEKNPKNDCIKVMCPECVEKMIPPINTGGGKTTG